MSDPSALPDAPNLEWLRKQAKRRLDELRQTNPAARLTEAQLALAREHGFPSWRALKAHIDALSVEGQLFDAAAAGDVAMLGALLDRHPDKLLVRKPPYAWTLLHVAAEKGRLAAVDLLLRRGLHPNTKEQGDETYAMHWAAAAGHLDIVRRLADAGGDVVGHGDDHGLEVIGWATCWNNYHQDIADFLVSRGARHNIFSAVAMNLEAEVRRIVAENPSALNARLTRNDNQRTPLHHAVLNNRPAMVSLLLELGADPLVVDSDGVSAAGYASAPGIDRRLMETIRAMTATEMDSAVRGHRAPNAGMLDLMAMLALEDWETARRLVEAVPSLRSSGALHLMAKRGDLPAVRWLLAHSADPNQRWSHWDAVVTPLHMAALGGHAEIARALLDAGADPSIHDSKHDGDAMGWARYFERADMVRVLEERLS